MTHAEMADALAPSGWDRKTVHRNLTDLTGAGLLRRSDMGDHVWRFELRPETEGVAHSTAGHPHFVCSECGEVLCLAHNAVQVIGGPGLPRFLLEGTVEIQVKGRCDRCG